MPAVKPAAAQPPPAEPQVQVQKKKLKDVDWSQKQFFDGDGLQGSEQVSTPAPEAPRRGRTLRIPAVPERPEPEVQQEAEGASPWGEAERPSAREAKETREAQKARSQEEARAASAKERAVGAGAARRTEKLAMQPPPLPGEAKPKGTLYEALENAKEPGVLFKEDDERSYRGGKEEDPELMEAVEECIRLLFGVRGIHHIGPGENEKGEPVVVVAAAQGFNEESMRLVPEQVGRFRTLVALPFDLLPLKRAVR